jgi:hypothetical protein
MVANIKGLETDKKSRNRYVEKLGKKRWQMYEVGDKKQEEPVFRTSYFLLPWISPACTLNFFHAIFAGCAS